MTYELTIICTSPNQQQNTTILIADQNDISICESYFNHFMNQDSIHHRSLKNKHHRYGCGNHMGHTGIVGASGPTCGLYFTGDYSQPVYNSTCNCQHFSCIAHLKPSLKSIKLI